MVHLATCPECGGRMDVTDLAPFTLVSCPKCESRVRVKTEVGPYRLDRRLAIGGMSVVFVAKDETLGREVVVKLLNEEHSGDKKRGEQFEKEAEMTASVSHPNVVRVYTVGRAFERFFIAMEFVEGDSLEVLMSEEGALPESRVLPLAVQVVDGLQAAQRAGLIHRDVKPGNILIDPKGTAKIVDFGLSLLTEEGSARADEIWATPYYVPPEALECEEEDFRSDIYALGATLYHALAGRPPIKTKEMATAKLREEKRMVPSLKVVAPWLQPETVAVVETAMAVYREDRFSSYDQFRDALERAQSALLRKGENPVQSPLHVERRRRARAHRKVLLGVLFGVLVGAVGVVGVVLARNGWLFGQDPGSGPEAAAVPVVVQGGVLDPAVLERIATRDRMARQALRAGDYATAEAEFQKLWKDREVPPRTAAWAGFEAALACWLDGRPGDGRHHLQELDRFVVENREEGTALGRQVRDAIRLMRKIGFLEDAELPGGLEDPFRAMVYFAGAVKTWEEGGLDRAGRLLGRFREVSFDRDAEWARGYQLIAQRYLADLRRLRRADHHWEGKSREELREAIARLQEIYLNLETRGRAGFNVKAWQTEVVRRLRELQAEAAEEAESAWTEARAAAAELFLAGAFGEAVARLEAVEPQREASRRERESLLWLAAEAAGFRAEVGRRLASGDPARRVVLRDGEELQGVMAANADGLLCGGDGGERRVAWTDLSPRWLADLAMDWTRDEPLAGRPLLGGAAACAALGGRMGLAEEVAAVLAAEDADFARRWEEMKRDLRR